MCVCVFYLRRELKRRERMCVRVYAGGRAGGVGGKGGGVGVGVVNGRREGILETLLGVLGPALTGLKKAFCYGKIDHLFTHNGECS